jgi:PAS domain S-box-containing protein
VLNWQLLGQLAIVFVAYFIAGRLGQATTNIRSSNLGPVWPAYGIALAAFLAYGYRVWPALAASAFLVALHGSVPPLAAAGQTIGATLAAVTGAYLLRRIANFDPTLSRLRDALGLIVLGAFGSAIISSSIGIASLYATRIQPYSGLAAAWFIYWFGDSTGVLLVTPLVFTLPQLFRIRSRVRLAELAGLLTLLTAACAVIFGDLPLIPIRLHAFAFVVILFVMWGAIGFGIAGASLTVFLIATTATLLTALGSGPFSAHTPFINAVLLDVLFAVLAVSGLALAAVIAERERAESDHAQLIREQAAMAARLRLAAIVESSDDAIISTSLDGVILSWNAAAQRIFGFTTAEIIGQPVTTIIPRERWEEEQTILQHVRGGGRIERLETTRITKTGRRVHASLTISPLRDWDGSLVGAATVLRDVSGQKRASEALSRLSRRLMAAQEEERSRIARELHDDIGQRLALLTAELTALAQRSSGQALTLQHQASQISADVQTLSRGLHSSKLELLGLTTGMKILCTEFSQQHQVRIDLETRDIPSQLPADTSLTLFRILQEALHNAVTHGRAPQCEVRLWEAEGWVHLVVKDHGAGFDVEVAKSSRGIGLISMEERVKLADGALSIESQPERGTTIHARVPVTPREMAES